MNHEPVRRSRGGSRPFVGKGIKFYLDEWAIVSQLMEITHLNITDLIKAAIADMARKNGLHFPSGDEPTKKVS